MGNHTVGAYRAFDFNQVNINAGGFLQDFLRAENNGFLALKANPARGFLPAYNAGIPGSQPLPVFAQLGSKGALTNADVINLIETGQVGRAGLVLPEQWLQSEQRRAVLCQPQRAGAPTC